MNTAANAFELVNSREVPSLNIVVEEYRHSGTGAEHIHLKSDNPENVFMVALRTVPMDSSGVAHVLEHTALCGSKKYPVRDPFFMMIRRSLNTFMNAFTSSDWTAYPFASQNRKDFGNLLDVVILMVFFPNLHELDFAQEGHRLELSDSSDLNSPLEIKGIVYNEMKGAMSSPISTLWQSLSEELYPTTTYHYNSGGDPENIPELTHEQLKNFHKNHYHPSNAIFMTFGDMEASQHQQKFTPVLGEFESKTDPIRVGLEKRFERPIAIRKSYALAESEPQEKATHHVIGWLLGSSIDLKATLEAQLLDLVLLENSSSPLQQALETTDLGRSPSPLCGADHSQREMCFVVGVEGSEPEHAEAVEELILSVLQEVAENGVAQSDIESCLHQLELQQREISGDAYPYGLQLMLSALNSATHGGDPVGLLDLEPALKGLAEEIKDPEYIKNLCRRLLLDNCHRVRLTLAPDSQLSANRDQALAEKLAEIKSGMSTAELKALVEKAQVLADRQNQEEDPEVLPTVSLEDVPKQMKYCAALSKQSDLGLTQYGVGTNGLVYQMAISELPQLNTEELYLLPLLTNLMTEVGNGDKSYLDIQRQQSAVCGGIGVSFSLRGTPQNAQDVRGYLMSSGKALYRNQSALTDLMASTLNSCRLDESDRIREIIAQIRSRNDSSITGNGHSLAMLAAAQYFSPAGQLNQFTGGLNGVQAIRKLDDSLKDQASLEAFLDSLQRLHRKIANQRTQWVLISEQDQLQSFSGSVMPYLRGGTEESAPLRMQPMTPKASDQMWIANTQVNFCAKAFPTVTTAHPDSAALTVLGGLLRNLYLHPAIREKGGAYGGGASQDNNNGAFRFYSYRDPRLADTLRDFDKSIESMLNDQIDNRHLEEAILGVVSSLDKPSSPAGEARQTFVTELFGRTRSIREEFRNRVLELKMQDLERVTQTYLTEDKASTAVVSHSQNEELAEPLGLSLNRV